MEILVVVHCTAFDTIKENKGSSDEFFNQLCCTKKLNG